MPNICFYFQVHQPYRIQEYSFFQIGKESQYENAVLNKLVLDKVSRNGYLKSNAMLLDLIHKTKGAFTCCMSLSGTAIEQMAEYRPDVLKSFQDLVATGCVELLAETHFHSLAFNYNQDEFEQQVASHALLIKKYFNKKPVVFRNTELIYSDSVAQWADKQGYSGIIAEGVPGILHRKAPNHLFKPKGTKHIKALFRNTSLSDDIAYRFQDKNWKQYPLTPKKYLQLINKQADTAEVFIIGMDYETFGEHHAENSGIFDFFTQTVLLLQSQNYSFKTPSEICADFEAGTTVHTPDFISWADTEKDLSAWLGNSMQFEALHKIYTFKEALYAMNNEELYRIWRKLQTSDHFYYMSTKQHSDGEVHTYFSPFNSPYDAYIYYMNIVSDFELSLKKTLKTKK